MLFFLWILLLLLLIISGVVYALYEHSKNVKPNCSCIGKPCNSTDGCGNACCGIGEACVGGKCCSEDCGNKSCAELNGCGESCEKAVCGDKKCYKGNCCEPNCDNKTCSDDGCGGICPCPNGEKCYNGACCTPPKCDGQFCGSGCGVECKCNDAYCYPGSCCSKNSCAYKDICNSPVGTVLKGQWGRFCDKCEGCDLLNPEFINNSIVPSSGILKCTHCNSKNVEEIKIDRFAYSYVYDDQSTSIKPTFDTTHDCGKVACKSDVDCARFNCTSCVGSVCK